MVDAAVTEDERREILLAHGLDPATASVIAITDRVLRVELPSGVVAVKVYPGHQRAVAQAEGALLLHLGGRDDPDVRVQALVTPEDGVVPWPLGERRVLVTAWAPGEHREYHQLDATAWTALGRSLAALHEQLDGVEGLALPSLVDDLRGLDPARERATLDEHRRRVQTSRAPGAEVLRGMLDDRARLLEQRLPRVLAELPSDPGGPIHNDYNVHNFLFTPGEPPVILDWERAMVAPREHEVCRCLNHLPIVAPPHATAFVDGYLQRRRLDPERLAWAADVAVSTHALKHWPVELWLRGAPGSVERLPGMAEITRALVTHADVYDAFFSRLCDRLRRTEP